MLQTYEAILQPNGTLKFTEPPLVQRAGPQRVLVTFTEPDAASDSIICGGVLSEAALAEDWLSEEEDEAWKHLQAAK